MAQYFIEAFTHNATTKKQTYISELLKGYHSMLVMSDTKKGCIIRGVEEMIEEYNDMFRGKKNYTSILTDNSKTTLQVHTEGNDTTSGLIFKLITRTI